MRNDPRLVVLLHGWLGRPGAFGQLPKILGERGHDVLPLFHQFDSWSRGVTMEELAERLEACLRRERRDRPTVLIAHSMGGLVALTWLLRHHAEQGRRPPIERLVTFGTPRHGVWLQPFARAFVDWGVVPGAALARQMRAPNPFLWDLAWLELRHASLLPPMVFGAGLLRRSNPVAALVGGHESDSVVPTVSAQPNPVFLSADGKTATLPHRSFHVFEGRAHNGPRGLYAGLKSPERDERTALLLAAVEEQVLPMAARSRSAADGLRQALCIVRHAPEERPRLIAQTADRSAPEEPVARHKAGLSLFLLRAGEPGGSIPVAGVRVGGRDRLFTDCMVAKGLGGGQVTYVDLSSGCD